MFGLVPLVSQEMNPWADQIIIFAAHSEKNTEDIPTGWVGDSVLLAGV